jgi:hypothetical protein
MLVVRTHVTRRASTAPHARARSAPAAGAAARPPQLPPSPPALAPSALLLWRQCAAQPAARARSLHSHRRAPACGEGVRVGERGTSRRGREGACVQLNVRACTCVGVCAQFSVLAPSTCSRAASCPGVGATSPAITHIAMTGHVSAMVKKQPVAVASRSALGRCGGESRHSGGTVQPEAGDARDANAREASLSTTRTCERVFARVCEGQCVRERHTSRGVQCQPQAPSRDKPSRHHQQVKRHWGKGTHHLPPRERCQVARRDEQVRERHAYENDDGNEFRIYVRRGGGSTLHSATQRSAAHSTSQHSTAHGTAQRSTKTSTSDSHLLRRRAETRRHPTHRKSSTSSTQHTKAQHTAQRSTPRHSTPRECHLLRRRAETKGIRPAALVLPARAPEAGTRFRLGEIKATACPIGGEHTLERHVSHSPCRNAPAVALRPPVHSAVGSAQKQPRQRHQQRQRQHRRRSRRRQSCPL